MVIDTNILIAYLNAEAKAVITLSNWKQDDRALFISSISFAEVIALSSLTDLEIQKVKNFLRNFIAIPLDNTVAEAAGLLRRRYRLEIPDAVIAATALLRDAPLVTRDKKFRKIKEITVLEI